MAQFKEATLANGDKIIVNMDEIRAMQRFPDTTTIQFDNHAIHVKEMPIDLLMRSRILSMN
jgi:uncharacterized protein YlzI (FlbEa/FlbD family)